MLIKSGVYSEPDIYQQWWQEMLTEVWQRNTLKHVNRSHNVGDLCSWNQEVYNAAYIQIRNAHYMWVEEHSENTHSDWNRAGKVTLQNLDSHHYHANPTMEPYAEVHPVHIQTSHFPTLILILLHLDPCPLSDL